MYISSFPLVMSINVIMTFNIMPINIVFLKIMAVLCFIMAINFLFRFFYKLLLNRFCIVLFLNSVYFGDIIVFFVIIFTLIFFFNCFGFHIIFTFLFALFGICIF